jgi:hypothetical protein
MGVGIGVGYVSNSTAKTCLAPEILDLTYQDAPEPTWQSTQSTRAWGDPWYDANSGSMTEWQS